MVEQGVDVKENIFFGNPEVCVMLPVSLQSVVGDVFAAAIPVNHRRYWRCGHPARGI